MKKVKIRGVGGSPIINPHIQIKLAGNTLEVIARKESFKQNPNYFLELIIEARLVTHGLFSWHE